MWFSSTVMTRINIFKNAGHTNHGPPLICSAACSCITSDYLLLLLPAALSNQRRSFWTLNCNYTQEPHRHAVVRSGLRRIGLHFTGRVKTESLQLFENVWICLLQTACKILISKPQKIPAGQMVILMLLTDGCLKIIPPSCQTLDAKLQPNVT